MRVSMRSQAGGGNWGQSSEVVVKARNSVVVAETERALSEGCRKIMIMYGGLHMQVGDDHALSLLLVVASRWCVRKLAMLVIVQATMGMV